MSRSCPHNWQRPWAWKRGPKRALFGLRGQLPLACTVWEEEGLEAPSSWWWIFPRCLPHCLSSRDPGKNQLTNKMYYKTEKTSSSQPAPLVGKMPGTRTYFPWKVSINPLLSSASLAKCYIHASAGSTWRQKRLGGHKKQKLLEKEQQMPSCHSCVGGAFYRKRLWLSILEKSRLLTQLLAE